MNEDIKYGKPLLEVGQTFESFFDLEKQLSLYQDKNFVQLYKRSSRTIQGCQKLQHLKKQYNPDLKYAVLDYTCIHGGKNFKSTSTGQRQNTRTYQIDCPMSIKVRTTVDGQNLVVTDINEQHNHDVTKELYQKLPRQRQQDRLARMTAEAMLQLKSEFRDSAESTSSLGSEGDHDTTEITNKPSDTGSADQSSCNHGNRARSPKLRKRRPIMKNSSEMSSDRETSAKEAKRPCIVTAPPLPYRRKNYLIRYYDHEIIKSGTKMVSLLNSSQENKTTRKPVVKPVKDSASLKIKQEVSPLPNEQAVSNFMPATVTLNKTPTSSRIRPAQRIQNMPSMMDSHTSPSTSVSTVDNVLLTSLSTEDKAPLTSVSTVDNVPLTSLSNGDKAPLTSVSTVDNVPLTSLSIGDKEPLTSVSTVDNVPCDSGLTSHKLLCIPSPLTCYPVRLEPGHEIKSELQAFVKKHDLKAAFVMSCVGSISRATLRMAGSKTIKTYDTNHDILSLVGTLSDGGHLHISLGKENGDVIGGHVVGDLVVYTTAEIMIGDCSFASFTRTHDPRTGYKELKISKR